MALRHLRLQTCKQFQQQPRREREWRANDEDCERKAQDDQEQHARIDEKPAHPARFIDDRPETCHAKVSRDLTLLKGSPSGDQHLVNWPKPRMRRMRTAL
jgi:hypothetical protein